MAGAENGSIATTAPIVKGENALLRGASIPAGMPAENSEGRCGMIKDSGDRTEFRSGAEREAKPYADYYGQHYAGGETGNEQGR